MKAIAITAFLAAAAMAAPAVTYRVVNDCIPGTASRVTLVDPSGKVHENGINCTVAPIVVADTVKADTTKKK